MLQSRQGAAPRVDREPVTAPRCQRAGDLVQVGPAGDPLVGDGVQPREHPPPGPRHVNRWPPPPRGRTPRPRTQSGAVMRCFPAGWTSSTSTAPPPAVTSNPSSVLRIAPGPPPPPPWAARAPHSSAPPPPPPAPPPGWGARP